VIYRALDLKVGLFRDAAPQALRSLTEAAAFRRRAVAHEADEAKMRRVVVTGMGIVSSIGNNTQEVLASRCAKRSRASCAPTNMPSSVSAARCTARRRSTRANRSTAAPCAFSAAARPGTTSPWSRRSATPASKSRGFQRAHRHRHGLRRPSTRAIVEAADITRSKGPKRVGPFAVPKAMSSSPSATLGTWFKIKGVNYSISSACATSNHCIGNAYEQIQLGKQDMIFAGGCEELDWTLSVLFDAMGAMSSKFNDTPPPASRAYDADRDGFVIAGGAGVVVLEELEHAKARGARIYAEVAGYGANSDGYDMVAPSGEGAARCMRMAIDGRAGSRRSTTSIRTPPRRRSAISRRSRRSARCSAPARSARRSPRPNR
jgi:3-oxoacyl-[acyl-carrier-protein] synthase-1